MIETTSLLTRTYNRRQQMQADAETEYRSRLLADAKRLIATRERHKQYERFPGEIELLILKMKHRLAEIALL